MKNTYHVYGPPGCGKTTRLASDAKLAVEKRGGHNVLITSLTRSAAIEIGSRGIKIPKENLGTLHSICFRSLGSPEIAEAHVDEWNDSVPHSFLKLTPRHSKKKVDDIGLDDPGGLQIDNRCLAGAEESCVETSIYSCEGVRQDPLVSYLKLGVRDGEMRHAVETTVAHHKCSACRETCARSPAASATGLCLRRMKNRHSSNNQQHRDPGSLHLSPPCFEHGDRRTPWSADLCLVY